MRHSKSGNLPGGSSQGSKAKSAGGAASDPHWSGMTSGTHRLVAELTSWAMAVSFCAFAFVYHEEIRAGMGLKWEPKARVAQAAPPAAADPAPHRTTSATSSGAGDSFYSVRLQADAGGHFNAEAYLNNDRANVLVDTGATAVALTWEDAQAAGLRVRDSDFTLRSSTANGVALFAPVTLESVRIGNLVVYDVPAVVARRGQLTTTLLGMSFLRQVRMEMKDRELVLSR